MCKEKPSIISLCTPLTSQQKTNSEIITDCNMGAVITITALHNAGDVLSGCVLVAMVLKGLPESYKQYAIHVTHSKENTIVLCLFRISKVNSSMPLIYFQSCKKNCFQCYFHSR